MKIETKLELKDSTQHSLKNQSKVEGILTSPIKLKNQEYYWGFFQLEGIDTEIPIIFKIKKKPYLALPNIPISGYEKPEIPSRAKILLTGTWSESLTSPRPSFTCQGYQVLANPPPLTLKDLKDQLSQLLTTSLDKKTEWQQRVDYLFRKQKDLQEIEKLDKLGPEYLQAYLLLRKAFYSNYQSNLLPYNQFSQEEYLNKLASEIEEVAQNIRAYQSKDLF